MPLRTLFLYLIGDRRAILAIARNPHSIWIALLFVLSAGFAREYDQKNLVRDPGFVIVPLIVSWLTASLLFAFASACLGESDRARPRNHLEGRYQAFLSLFWMTAPLAWLYAIPYEEFLSEVDAARANLITLGVVSLWRVLLMIRVVQVLLGFPVARAFFVVTFFANGVAILALTFWSISIVGIMGGVTSQPPGEQLTLRVAEWITQTSCIAVPALFVGLVVTLCMGTTTRPDPTEQSVDDFPKGKGLWMPAVLSLIVWIGILPFTQRKFLLAGQVELLVDSGRVDEAVRLMSEKSPEDFPRHWEPPPTYGSAKVNLLLRVLRRARTESTAPWVREAYLENAKRRLTLDGLWDPSPTLEMIDAMRAVPGGDKLVQEMIAWDSEVGQKLREYLKQREEAQQERQKDPEKSTD